MGSYSMTKFSEIAYRCLHDDREQRPSMDIVAKELEETLNVAHELEEKRKHQDEEDIEMSNDDDEYWEKRLPHNYPHLIEMSDIPLNYTTKKELYLLFRRGFLANSGCRGFLTNSGFRRRQLWFSTCKSTRGICSIQPSTHVLFMDSGYKRLETLSLPESRFKKVKKLRDDYFYEFTCRLESFMFSPGNYNYARYLLFKLEDGHVLSNDGPILKAVYKMGGNDITIPITIKKPKEESGSSKSIDGGTGMSKHNYADPERSWVEKRDDGWLEASFTKPLSKQYLETLTELKVDLWKLIRGSLNGIIVEGVEFRPVVVDNHI
ncbi:serine-threonine/tyrosine-protein kinase catalytic domain-containing protein [Tanacetum coccineum]